MKSHYRNLSFFAVWLWLLLISLPLSSRGLSSHEFDHLFAKANTAFLTNWFGGDWKWLKAQGIAESALDPKAVSPAGAMGLMQIMPPTWTEMADRMNINSSPFDPAASIMVGAVYMRLMQKIFRAERPQEDRNRWAWSAYNCGAGCVLKAQKKAGNTHEWWWIRSFLPQETIVYVYRIEQYKLALNLEP